MGRSDIFCEQHLKQQKRDEDIPLSYNKRH